jgi:hypothetical protein
MADDKTNTGVPDPQQAATNRIAQHAVSDITANLRGGPDADAHHPAAASAVADEEAGALGPNPVKQQPARAGERKAADDRKKPASHPR